VCCAPTLANAAEAQEHWTKQCAKCHGPDGSGNTMMGKKLKLQNYQDPAVQAAMTDEKIAQVIKEGVKNEAGKLVMPVFADKIPEEDIRGMIAFVRSFKR